jgi:hypothetical protein
LRSDQGERSHLPNRYCVSAEVTSGGQESPIRKSSIVAAIVKIPQSQISNRKSPGNRKSKIKNHK